jgi:dimethylamine--corrinoid protein Co-methyltransferase
MGASHAIASGMGGMRAGGDLVARLQMTRGMRLKEAKEYVAGKLGCSTRDLSDPAAMWEIRAQHGFGRFPDQDTVFANEPLAMEAKFRIAEVLDIPINSVQRFAAHAGLV